MIKLKDKLSYFAAGFKVSPIVTLTTIAYLIATITPALYFSVLVYLAWNELNGFRVVFYLVFGCMISSIGVGATRQYYRSISVLFN